jgi:RNA polymerase sigma-70 factor (ECF subfamily)
MLSFEEFYTANAGRLVAQLYLVAGSMEEARDCVQDAFARAWLHWEALSRPDANPVAWVHTVGYRIAISGWRRRQAHRRALERHGTPRPAPPPSPDAVAVAAALAELPPGHRAVIILHYFEDQPIEQIARVLKLTPSGVKPRLMRARATLAPLLAEHDPNAKEADRA